MLFFLPGLVCVLPGATVLALHVATTSVCCLFAAMRRVIFLPVHAQELGGNCAAGGGLYLLQGRHPLQQKRELTFVFFRRPGLFKKAQEHQRSPAEGVKHESSVKKFSDGSISLPFSSLVEVGSVR